MHFLHINLYETVLVSCLCGPQLYEYCKYSGISVIDKRFMIIRPGIDDLD